MSYTCACCGEIHEGLPDLGFDRPAYVNDVPEEEWPERVQLESDLCILDNTHYFVRGLIEIPVHGQEATFGLGVWASQKKENFDHYVAHFDSAEIGPFFGWLSNELMFEGVSTLSLKTMVHFRGQGLRPRIQLELSDHPLARAQYEGICLGAAWTFLHAYL